MNDKRSFTEYLVIGTPQTQFAIGFKDYASGKDKLLLTVDGVPANTAGYTVKRNIGNILVFTPAVPVGSTVRIQRETSIDEPFFRFTAGNPFVPSNVDDNYMQLIHSQQEVLDGFNFLESNTLGVIEAAKDATERANEAADTVEGLIIGKIPASTVTDRSGLTQQQINDSRVRVVDNITDLYDLQSLDGDVVIVRSKQGGTFVFDSTRVSDADDVVNFKGYIRKFTGNIQSDWSGVVGDATNGAVGTDCVPLMQKSIDAAYKYGVDVDFNHGTYRCVSLTKVGEGYSTEWYFFKLRPNVVINIPKGCRLIAADGTVESNAWEQGTTGFIFFSDAKEDCPNAEVCGGGTLDHNGANNLLNVINGWGNQSTTPTFLLTANSHNSKFHHLIVLNNTGHNHFVNEKSTDTEFHHNTLYNFADSVEGNVNCADHSAVYSRGKRCVAYNNIMINPRNSYVSTGFEMHGAGCTAHTNYTKNVAVLGLGASYTTTDVGNVVTFKSNIGVGLVSAFAADVDNHCELIINIKDNICGISGLPNNPNDVYGRKGHDYITMREPNNAYMPKRLDIRDSGNTITWDDPVDWTVSDHLSCSAFVVRKVTSWISTQNTFINLKGSAINFGFQHVDGSNMDAELSFSNKYINCGVSAQSAYDFTNDGVPDGFSLINKLTIDDVFEGCGWGYIYNNRAKIASYVFAPLVFNLKIRSDMYHDVMIGHQATADLYCEYNIVMNQPSAGLTYKPLPIDNPVCGTIKINHGKSNKFMTFTKFIGLSRWKMKSLWFDQSLPTSPVSPFGDRVGDELDLFIYSDSGATKLVCVKDGVSGGTGVWRLAGQLYA